VYRDIIGIVGGMGSFATLDFFGRVLRAFPAVKEWERPRVLIDNRCTMPSRVRAILYHEQVEYVTECLAESTRNLLHGGATVLILACNTSHVFLEPILERVPEAQGKVINIIEETGRALQSLRNRDRYLLLASEGTLDSGIYQKYCEQYGVQLELPDESVYPKLRNLIEDVKQDRISDGTLERFLQLITSFENHHVILGCTEFPAIYARCRERKELQAYHIYDPLTFAIRELKRRVQ